MESAKKEMQPVKYTIRIKNHIDINWERWFEGMRITHKDDGVTVLSGYVVDQAALVGLLEKIHGLNLTLISVQKFETENGE